MAEAMEWHGKSVSQPTKKVGAGLKKERPIPEVKPSPRKKQDAENEDPMTHPRHKELNEQKNT